MPKARFVTLTRWDSMEQRHFFMTISVDSIETITEVEQGRWGSFNAEVTLKSGQSFLVREKHSEVLEGMNNDHDNTDDGDRDADERNA